MYNTSHAIKYEQTNRAKCYPTLNVRFWLFYPIALERGWKDISTLFDGFSCMFIYPFTNLLLYISSNPRNLLTTSQLNLRILKPRGSFLLDKFLPQNMPS